MQLLGGTEANETMCCSISPRRGTFPSWAVRPAKCQTEGWRRGGYGPSNGSAPALGQGLPKSVRLSVLPNPKSLCKYSSEWEFMQTLKK
jgi:hypothetical protein